jgi:hypothetical protein
VKHCCSCQERKPLADFHRSKRHGGLSPRCKPCGIAYAKNWYVENKDRKRAYDALRRLEKRHLYRAASKRWRDSNAGLKNADTQTRRAVLRGAMPRWANKFFISEIYDLAALRTKLTGFRWVVDHVIPLRGRNVCGLHVETNLRVIPETANLAKSNHFSLEHNGVR